jgi:hypothetical protein
MPSIAPPHGWRCTDDDHASPLTPGGTTAGGVSYVAARIAWVGKYCQANPLDETTENLLPLVDLPTEETLPVLEVSQQRGVHGCRVVWPPQMDSHQACREILALTFMCRQIGIALGAIVAIRHYERRA